MTEKVYIAQNNMATFICPVCKKTTTVDVTSYAELEKKVKVKCRCVCGHNYTSILEKRKKYRKSVNFPGVYAFIDAMGREEKGTLVVEDISATGLKLKLNIKPSFKIEDILTVEFHLNDKRRTEMQKKVIVKNIKNIYVGTAFTLSGLNDPALGFYLMN